MNVYTPRTNGIAERFIQTSLREWAYAPSMPTPPIARPISNLGSIATAGIDLIALQRRPPSPDSISP
jgi:hypothetical protein